MACQFPGQAWQHYDIAFRKYAAATGLTDWFRMNLDLYNFHTRSPVGSSSHPLLQHRRSSQFSYTDAPKSPHYCHSWNDGECRWPFGRCCFVTPAGHAMETTLKSTVHFALAGTTGDLGHQPPPGVSATGTNSGQVASAQSNSGVNSCFCFIAQAGLQKSVSLVAGDTPLVNVKDPSAVDTTAPLGQATGAHSPQLTSMCQSGHGISQLKPVPMVTPINADKLQAKLHSYPNQARASYVLSDIRSGFRLGFDASRLTLKSASTNMHSSTLHPAVIDDYLHTELQKGRVAGPFSTPPWPNLHISWFGVIPKKNQPGKWHLILDLSSPAGSSMNDGIPKESSLCSI